MLERKWDDGEEEEKKEGRAVSRCSHCGDIDRGVECTGSASTEKHFLCSACLDEEIHLQCSVKYQTEFTFHDQHISCPLCLPLVITPFPDDLLREQGSRVANATLTLARRRATEAESWKRENQKFHSILDDCIAHSSSSDIQRHRYHILECLQTIRCPSCNVLCSDFEGSSTIKCEACRISYCALCVKECGGRESRLSHAKGCCANRPEEKSMVGEEKEGALDGFVGSFHEINIAHSLIRAEKVSAYLRSQVDKTHLEAVKAAIKDDLNRFGVIMAWK